MYDITDLHPEIILKAINGFYSYLDTDGRAQKILSQLTAEEYAHVKERQFAHWKQIVKPNVDKGLLTRNATHVGKIHGIIGLRSSSIANGGSFFQRTLFDAIHRLDIKSEDKELLMSKLATRIQDETEAQLIAMDEHQALIDSLTREAIKPTAQRLWMDKRQYRLSIIAQLPGVAGVLWLGRNQDNSCVIEASILNRSTEHETFINQYLLPKIKEVSETPYNINIHNVAQLTLDDAIKPKGFNTLTARPVFDVNNQPIGWVVVLGTHPAMFLGKPTHRFIEITLSQFKIDLLNQQHIQSGKSEQDIQHLKRLLYTGGLTFFYQPIVQMQDGACYLLEALARLKDDDGNIIPPGAFLPYFGYEELKFIFLEGLKQSFKQLNEWEKQGKQFEISINLPPEILIEPQCVTWIQQALAEQNIQAHRLHLELLETEEIISNRQRDLAIHGLNKLGVSLKMDDLGAGHSGLIRLKELPFAGIKIDQQIVRDLDTPKVLKVLAIIKAMLSMSISMGISSVVEGLENPDEIEVMGILGAEFAQGFHISRPIPAEQVLPWLNTFNWQYDFADPQTDLGMQVLALLQIEEKDMHKHFTTSNASPSKH